MNLKYISLLLLPYTAFALNCHPKVNTQLPQYIIGYGSLIDEQSKKRTDSTAEESLPALITGYRRSWSVHGNLPGLNTTFLAVSEDQASSFNGVIYKLSAPEQIEEYDKRESLYCRKELSSDQLNVYTIVLPTQKQMWIYIPIENPHLYPTQKFPIVQSYVDTFLRGCIHIEEHFKIKNFAKDCIKSTDQWSMHWINDRVFPRRPSLFEPYASKIDILLKEMLPEQFKKITFENAVDVPH